MKKTPPHQVSFFENEVGISLRQLGRNQDLGHLVGQALHQGEGVAQKFPGASQLVRSRKQKIDKKLMQTSCKIASLLLSYLSKGV